MEDVATIPIVRHKNEHHLEFKWEIHSCHIILSAVLQVKEPQVTKGMHEAPINL
jgi:hypothetical protein